jgi:hypothetical protein
MSIIQAKNRTVEAKKILGREREERRERGGSLLFSPDHKSPPKIKEGHRGDETEKKRWLGWTKKKMREN